MVTVKTAEVERSLRRSSRSTKTGTNVAANTPPTSSSYTMLGVMFARLYVSASDSLPIAAASTTTRNRPVIRDKRVPAATAALDRTSPARP
jgi:hypothetical protein